jgi:hypothetical protein
MLGHMMVWATLNNVPQSRVRGSAQKELRIVSEQDLIHDWNDSRKVRRPYRCDIGHLTDHGSVLDEALVGTFGGMHMNATQRGGDHGAVGNCKDVYHARPHWCT